MINLSQQLKEKNIHLMKFSNVKRDNLDRSNADMIMEK